MFFFLFLIPPTIPLANVENKHTAIRKVKLSPKEVRVQYQNRYQKKLNKMTMFHELTKDNQQLLTCQIQTSIKLIGRLCLHRMNIKHNPSRQVFSITCHHKIYETSRKRDVKSSDEEAKVSSKRRRNKVQRSRCTIQRCRWKKSSAVGFRQQYTFRTLVLQFGPV